ncbi:MAG: polymerase, sigma-24 subunit, subfamily [Adhaeribacter sp.]|nr:polymerase, sigma-24 subunit, subfamily [Adhaeribacter sp.]
MESNPKLFSDNLGNQETPAIHSGNSEPVLKGQEAIVLDKESFIRHAFANDPQLGIELLYRHYFQSLCSHAVRLLYSQAIAEDLVSEIFYQLYASGSYQNIKTSYRAYLYRVVRNRALNYKRDESKCSHDIDQCGKIPDTYHQRPDAIAEYGELYNCLEEGINSLPTQCRKIFLMNRFENKKYSEIAEELQLSPRTIEVQIRKARHFLRTILIKYKVLLILIIPFNHL